MWVSQNLILKINVKQHVSLAFVYMQMRLKFMSSVNYFQFCFELFCAQNYIKRTRTQPTPAGTKISEVLDVGICSTSNKAETKIARPVSAQHQTLLVAKAKWPPLLLLLSINKQRV